MTPPKEPTGPAPSQELEEFDVFGDTVRRRVEDLTETLDEMAEKATILEYGWIFNREDWHLYADAKYGRCRMISSAYNEDGTYTVVAVKAWEEDRELLVSGRMTPAQYVRYVSPKAQIAHFSQAASRILDEQMREMAAEFQGDKERGEFSPHEFLYEAAFGSISGWAGVELPKVEVSHPSYEFYRDSGYLDILRQAVTSKKLDLNSVREPAWKWGVFNDNPTPKAYEEQIGIVSARTDIPELAEYRREGRTYQELILSSVKSEVARRWNEANNIDEDFFTNPGLIDPELYVIYEERFQKVIEEIEQLYIENGYDPSLYKRDIVKIARVRIFDLEMDNSRETHTAPITWSKQETVEALRFVLNDIGGMFLDEAIDDALLVTSLFGEMPAVLEPTYEKMAALGLRSMMSNADLAMVGQFVVLPKLLTVGKSGEVAAAEQPKTMREWVESIGEWTHVQDDEFSYLFHAHIKPDGSILYAELRVDNGIAINDMRAFVRAHSKKVLLANFYPTAVQYLQKYHDRKVLEGSDYHRAIHVKQFYDRPLNDGIHKKIEFVHNA